jgi:CRP/FNR family transcriptional regulator
MDEKMIIIRKNDFLAQLRKEDYEQLNIIHNFIVADKDAYIYFDVQDLNKLYFVKEGFVKLGIVDEEGNELIKDILKPGDIFGQFSLERESTVNEFAQAHKQHTILCSFTIQDFQKLLESRPELTIIFSKKIGQKLKKVENRVLNLLQKDVRGRLLYFFWTLVDDVVQPESNTLAIDNFMTHEDIARLTGTSRQTVTTVINQLSEEGIITVDRKQIIIHDKKLLQKLAKVG